MERNDQRDDWGVSLNLTRHLDKSNAHEKGE